MEKKITELERQAEILAFILNGDEVSKDSAALQYSTTPVTIDRDIKSLRSKGIDIASRKKRFTVIAPNLETLNTIASEYLPLKLSSTIYYDKIKLFSQHSNDNYFSNLILISKAINEKRFLRIKYIPFNNEAKEYYLQPIALINDDKNWILSAIKEGENNEKLFYLSKILTLKMLDKKFETRSTDKNKSEPITLKFEKDVAEQIFTKIYFDDYDIKEFHDYIILTANVEINNRIASWCISWWDKVEILESTKLKKYISDMIESFQIKNPNN